MLKETSDHRSTRRSQLRQNPEPAPSPGHSKRKGAKANERAARSQPVRSPGGEGRGQRCGVRAEVGRARPGWRAPRAQSGNDKALEET